jgi:hypothetical protein
LNAVSSVAGARSHEFENGVLKLKVDAGWTRLEIRST